MAPCHHGNGATGLPCRGAGHVRSPVERSTGASRAPSTGHQLRAPSCHLPSTLWPRHRAHLLLLHHPPQQDATQQDVTPAGCHPGRTSPWHDAAPAGQPGTAAAGCSALGTRGWSRLFPEQPNDDAHRQGYNLAKHSAGALEGAGPRQLIIQSRTHRAHACHSNEGVCAPGWQVCTPLCTSTVHTLYRAGAAASQPASRGSRAGCWVGSMATQGLGRLSVPLSPFFLAFSLLGTAEPPLGDARCCL